MLGGGPSHVSAHVSAPAPAGASPGRSIPPPKVVVAARGVGPITEPNVNDVLSGRGGRINAHPGNVGFRSLIAAHKARYLSPATRKLEKAHIAAEVVEAVRGLDPPGRFLKQDSEDGAWWDIGDVKARKKVGQALREDAPDIRPALEQEEHHHKQQQDQLHGNLDHHDQLGQDALAIPEDAPLIATTSSPRLSHPGAPRRSPSYTSGRGFGGGGGGGGRAGSMGGRGGGHAPSRGETGSGGPGDLGWLGQSATSFGRGVYHPADFASASGDISELSLNVGAGLETEEEARIDGGGGGGDAGDSSGFSHRNAWQASQQRSRAEHYQAQWRDQQQHQQRRQHHQHHQHHHNQQHQHERHNSRAEQFLEQQRRRSQLQLEMDQQPQLNELAPPVDQTPLRSNQHHLPRGAELGGGGGGRADRLMASSGGSRDLRYSGMSDLSISFGLRRSLSLPGIQDTAELMTDASFQALLDEHEELDAFDADVRNLPRTGTETGGPTGTASKRSSRSEESNFSALTSSGSREGQEIIGGGVSARHPPHTYPHPQPQPHPPMDHQASMMSMASVRSASSWMKNFRGSDMGSFAAEEFSYRSIVSEMSTELMALDLADSGIASKALAPLLPPVQGEIGADPIPG